MRHVGEKPGMRQCPACLGCGQWVDVLKFGETWQLRFVDCEYCAGLGNV